MMLENDGATAGTPSQRSREDRSNSLLGMFEAVLEENTEGAIHQENSRVDTDVSIDLTFSKDTTYNS